VLPATNQLYIKDSYVFGCLRDGARHTRRKRGTLQPYLVATLQVVEPVIPTTNRVLPPEPPPPPDEEPDVGVFVF
jgi:hypothetical protein